MKLLLNLIFIIITNIAFIISLKINLSTRYSDFCFTKLLEKDDSLGIELIVINLSAPEKNKVNLIITNTDEAEFLKNYNQSSEINDKITITRSSIYKFCFKPIYTEEIIVDFNIYSGTETKSLVDIANESKL